MALSGLSPILYLNSPINHQPPFPPHQGAPFPTPSSERPGTEYNDGQLEHEGYSGLRPGFEGMSSKHLSDECRSRMTPLVGQYP
jgi:hypothetical protein